MSGREILERPWAWVIGGALISSWLLGVFHAYGAHGRMSAAAALILPPYGLYLAVEQISHAGAGDVLDLSKIDTVPADAEGAYMEQCLQKRVVSDQISLGETQNEVFCACSVKMLSEGVSEREDEYVLKHGQNSAEFMVYRREVSENCLVSARSVGSSDSE